MALFVHFVVLFLYVKLPEEIEGDDGVNIHNNSQQHHRQHQLLSVVRYGLQDGTQSLKTDRDVQQVSGEEEIIVIPKDRKGEVPQTVQERLKISGFF